MEYLTTLKINSDIGSDESLRSITGRIHLAIRGSGIPIPSVPAYRIDSEGNRLFESYSVDILFSDIKIGLVSLRQFLSEAGYIDKCELRFSNAEYNLLELSKELY